MAVENFSGYTEVDPNTKITKTSTRVTWVGLTRVEDAYVYKDKTANYFDGDFTHQLTVNSVDLTAPAGQATNIAICWAVGNTIGSWQDVDDASGDQLHLYIRVEGTGSKHKFLLGELDGGAAYNSATDLQIAGNTPYYLKITRDESVGTYGTLYCYVYSNPARTTLVGTLSLTLHTSKKDFRYLYAMQSLGAAAAGFDHDGYTENLSIFAADAGYAATFPSDPTTRVTGLVHRYSPGNYTLEIFLGDTKTDWSDQMPSVTDKPAKTLEKPASTTTQTTWPVRLPARTGYHIAYDSWDTLRQYPFYQKD